MSPKNTIPHKPQKEQLTGLKIIKGEHVSNTKKLILLIINKSKIGWK